MPELPDVEVYRQRLEALLGGATLAQVRVASPFVVRTFEPPLSAAHGRTLRRVRRMGKRLVLELDGALFLVLHLMIAGRLHWKPEEGAKVPARVGLLAFDFPGRGTLLFTEASGKKRASLHVVDGEAGLTDFERGGLEVLDATLESFREALQRESHTLKRALTDPRLFSGIGNAYSDEILHRARLSPMKLTRNLTDAEAERLYTATRETLTLWTERLRQEVGDGFPEKVTAFREEMAVHGRYRQPCPDCGAPVQRIVYAENEANYCARCQTEGRLLSDRSLARLMKDDWPRTLEELEERRAALAPAAPPKPPVASRRSRSGA